MAHDRPERNRVAVRYARITYRLRWVIVAAWVAGAAAATVFLPALQTSGSGDLGSLVPAHSAATQTERRVLHDFKYPLDSNVAVVVHNESGLDPLTQLDVVLWALRVDQQLLKLQPPYPNGLVLGALPVLNTAHLFPTSHRPGTTAVTYLFFAPSTTLAEQTRLANEYAQHFTTDGSPGDHPQTAVTGMFPAQVQQSNLVMSHLMWLEIATLVLVTLIVAVTFRSVIAPIVLLAAAVLTYLVALRVLGYVGSQVSVNVPQALEPLVVALILGILTDYSVFFLTGMRRRLQLGKDVREAFLFSLRDNIPIVAVAGLTVAAGTGALYASRLQLFRSFGPGLAIAVLVGTAAATTFVPAAMGILGTSVYWPSKPGSDLHPEEIRVRLRPSWLVKSISRKRGATVAAALATMALGAACYPLTHLHLDTSFIDGLPHGQPAYQGAQLAKRGFAYGVLAPTTVLVSGPQVKTNGAGLNRLQTLIGHQPGVAGVLGPATIPFVGPQGIFVRQDKTEARYLVFLDGSPLGGDGISEYRHLRDNLPTLLQRADLGNATVATTGDTAIASAAASETVRNLVIVYIAAFVAELIILALFLRALLAPLLLLLASSLVIAASLGLTTWVFQDHLNATGLTFYAPFATTVLLLALGSDYNVFGTGRIWEEAANNPLKRAIRRALPESARAITTAGLTLAGSFALIAIIPLTAFHEMAFTMFAGLLIDTFLVRSIVTPALLTLVGPAAGWPGSRLNETPPYPREGGYDKSQETSPSPVVERE